MKKIFTLLVLCTICVLSAMGQAIVKFDKTNIDLGAFTEDKTMKCEFTFTNTGNKPLILQQVFSSCGCTVPSYSKDPIQPGKKGTIAVSYNGKGKFPGHFTKMIIVRSNASNSMVRIYIEGTMNPKPQDSK